METTLSEETTLKFKLVTLATISIGILSACMIVAAIWITNISTTQADLAKVQSTHGEDIATLKQNDINQKEALSYIVNRVDEIRNDQIRRYNPRSK